MNGRLGATFFLLATFAASLALSDVVEAQVQTPTEAAPLQFGVVSLYPTLQIIDAGKDSNIFDDGEDPKEDYIFTAASRIVGLAKLGANELLFSAGNDYVWFREFADQRSTNNRHAVRLNMSALRVKPFVGVERQHTRERPNSEIDARARRLGKAATAGIDVALADRTSFTASVRFDDLKYDEGQRYRGEDLAHALNRTGRSMTAGVRYELTPLTRLLMAVNYAEDDFPSSHVRDAKWYSITPTFEFNPDAVVRGQFSAGYQKFMPADPTLSDYQGFVYDGGVSWTLFGRTTFALNGGRGTRYSYQETEPYYVMTGGRLNVVHHVMGPVDLIGGADYEHMAYRWHRGVSVPDGQLDYAHTLTEVSGGVGVNIVRGFKFALRAERTRRRSPENPLQDFHRTRLVTSTTIGY